MPKSVDERLSVVEAELAAVKARVEAIASNRGPAPLPEVNIDGQYGDPEVRKDPPRWDGASCVGKRYSQCPADYLDNLAGFLQWKAGKEEAEGKDKYAGYSRLDAARAIAWAKRKRQDANRYGKSGGGPAKHSAPPERDLDAELDGDEYAAQYDDDGGLPF